jgi:CHAT domain-containing protein/tetratricopeptide (TPR) repeat protein
MKKSLFTLLIVLTALIAHSQDYKTLKAKVQELENARDYSNAVIYAEKAVKQAEAEYGADNFRYGNALQKLAEMYRSAGMLQQAEQIFLKVMEIDKNKFGETEMVYAEDLNRLGRLYIDMTFYEKAAPLFVQAAEIYKVKLGANSSMYASSLCNLAATHYQLGKYNDADLEFLKSIEIYSALNELTENYSNALNGLATLYTRMVRLEESEKIFIASLEIVKKLKGENSYDYGFVLGNLAYLYNDMGRHFDSDETYAKAMKIMQPYGTNTLEYGHLIYGVGVNYTDIGYYGEAEDLLKKSLSITKKIQGDQSSTYGTGLNGLANLYADVGNYQDAEVLYKQAIGITEKTLGKKHLYYAITRENLATLYNNLGRHQQALEIFQQNLEIMKNIFGEEHPEYAATLSNVGNTQALLFQFDLAKKTLERARVIQEKILGKKHPDYIKTIMMYAGVLSLTKNYTEAITYYNDAIKSLESEPKQNTNLLSLKLERAVLYYITDNYELAEKEYLETMGLVKQKLGNYHTLYNLTLMNLGAQYYYLKNDKRAGEILKQMADNFIVQIEQNFPAMSEEEKNSFTRFIKRYFEIYDNYAVRVGQSNPAVLGEMYNYHIFIKGLLVNSSLKVRNRILNSNNPELISLYQNWLKKKEEVARYHKLPPDELLRLKINLADLETEANTLEKEVSLKSELFRKNNEKVKYSWQDIKGKLKAGEAAIEIIQYKKHIKTLSDSSVYAALIIKYGASAPEVVVLNNGTELETRYLKYYKNMIVFNTGDSFQKDEVSYGKFWLPISKKLEGIKKIYFAPDGVFHSINLNTLYDTTSKKYLVDILEIHQLSNTSELMLPADSKNNQKNDAKLFGFPQYDLPYNDQPQPPNKEDVKKEINISNPTIRGSLSTEVVQLPGTKREVEQIKILLEKAKWDVKSYVSSNALEEEIKTLKSPTVLHVATHGFFEPNLPDENPQNSTTKKSSHQLFRSGILLARASVSLNKKLNLEPTPFHIEDGILTAYEAMNLNLDNTNLVILSACETGLGDVQNGEGVYGLQRAFKVAGAQSIIMSLWKVSDEATQKLMVAFYENWIKTGNKREAFRLAQKSLKEQFPEPYKWGAFVMIGE